MAVKYNKYDFISPAEIYARVKEEFRTYFDSGLIDDSLFEIYTEDCLNRMGKGARPIVQTVLFMEDNRSLLPSEFLAVREAWSCHQHGFAYQNPSSTYLQQVKETCTKMYDSADYRCDPCAGCKSPLVIETIYKHTGSVYFQWERTDQLEPANLNEKDLCHHGHHRYYDIQENHLITTFKQGTVNLVYYADSHDADGNLLIPDIFEFKDYLLSYLKFKIMEVLFNVGADESIYVLERKLNRYEQYQAEKQILCESAMKRKTIHQKRDDLLKQKHRFDKYRIPKR